MIKFILLLSSVFLTQVFAIESPCDWVYNCSDAQTSQTSTYYVDGVKYSLKLEHELTYANLDVLNGMSDEQYACSKALAKVQLSTTKQILGVPLNHINSAVQSNQINIDFSQSINIPSNVHNCVETATGVKCKIIGCVEDSPVSSEVK